MLKNVSTRPWICSGCIHRQQLSRRSKPAEAFRPFLYNSRRSSILVQARGFSIGFSNTGTSYDDRTLRQVFDSPGLWKEFSQPSKSSYGGQNYGLFQNRYLTNPRGFELFAHTSLNKAKRIVERVLAASTRQEYHQVVRQLDRLSDLLCRVIDLADFVRATHPDRQFQAAAARSHSIMYEYMNVLNATTGLAEQLDIALSDETAPWSEQEKMVGKILKKDFAKSAIDLTRAQQERFVSLSQEIQNVGSNFAESMAPQKYYLTFNKHQLAGADPLLLNEFANYDGSFKLPTMGMPALMALRTVRDPSTRKEILMASRTASHLTVENLQTLLKKRAELARLVGYTDYGQMALADKMAEHPGNVRKFLNNLNAQNYDEMKVQTELLVKAKALDLGQDGQNLLPWDKEYYMSKKFRTIRSNKRYPDFLSSYFSLGTVMQGLSRLFTQLYGIRFVPRETTRGETWNSDVRRLDVISDTHGHVAVLYCDLFARPGKSPNPAHFTLRCSRFIRNSEIEEAQSVADPLFASPEEAANDGMAISREGKTDGVMQLPVIALICDFSLSESKKPALLGFGEVTTLFHEMGHAIHSILGRTDFQEVSGTRVATDFAELPSILMEHFASDPTVLSLFARHYETDKPLPFEMVADQLALNRQFEAFEVDNQITLSALDQELHSSKALEPSFSSTKVYQDLQQQISHQPADPPGTSWQGFFGHLFGYGGTYYSYLFDRVLARRIWQRVFSSGRHSGSISRSNGEMFKENVLKWGGGRDPWLSLAGAMKDDRFASSNYSHYDLMRLVGNWGLEGRIYEQWLEKKSPEDVDIEYPSFVAKEEAAAKE